MRPSVVGLPSLLLLLSQSFPVCLGAWSEEPWVWDDASSTRNAGLRSDLESPDYQCDTTAAWRADVIARLREDVSSDYEVFEGVLDFPAFAQPAGRYGLVNLPPEQAPPALCAIARNVPSPYGPQLCNRTFVLGPRDAVVGLLCTPPPVRYFGLRSYTIFRFRPSPWLSAAELADPINNLIINTTSNDPNDVFRRTAAVVSTADGVVQRRLTAALERAGVPGGAINQDVVSADKAYFRDTSKVWLRDRSDALGWLFRVSSFVNATEVEPYFKQKWPVLLLRAKESKGLRPRTEPLATPPFRPRGTGFDEAFLAPQVQALIGAVSRHMTQRHNASLHRIFNMSHILPDVDRCLTDPTYSPIEGDIPAFNITAIPTCGFFTRDALYTWMDSSNTPYDDLYFPKNRVYFFVGVNQPLLKKSAYLNIFMTAVASPQKPGRTFNYSAPALVGTATPYAPDLPDIDKLFAVRLARDCDDDDEFQCTTVTEKAINLTEYVYIVQRQYLEPSTQIGPSPDECVLPVVLSYTLPEAGMRRRDPAIGEEDQLVEAA